MAEANNRTDKCGNPFPDVCTPQQVRTPICYLTTSLQNQGVMEGLPGFLVIDVAPDCSGAVVAIENSNGAVVNGAFQVPCASTLGPGGIEQPPPPQGGGS